MSFEVFDVVANNMHFRGKRWHAGHRFPIFALHGWLDNCASFDFLAPLLTADLLCVDMAGHGRTDARANGGPYLLTQDVDDVFQIAEQFGFDEFGLLGHSRGAMGGVLAAAAYPEKIKWLGLVEGIIPPVSEAHEAPQLLRKSIEDKAQYRARERNTYTYFDKAVSARENGLFRLSHDEALALANWGVEKTENGYAWCYDPEVMSSSSVRYSREQITAFISEIKAPLSLVLGDKGIYQDKPYVFDALEALEIKPTVLAGGHHLHMQEQAAAIAKIFNDSLTFVD